MEIWLVFGWLVEIDLQRGSDGARHGVTTQDLRQKAKLAMEDLSGTILDLDCRKVVFCIFTNLRQPFVYLLCGAELMSRKGHHPLPLTRRDRHMPACVGRSVIDFARGMAKLGALVGD
jgi:hypothetical protein